MSNTYSKIGVAIMGYQGSKKQKEQFKKYYKKHQALILARSKLWQLQNKSKRLLWARAYRQKTAQKMKEYQKSYRAKNKNKIKQYNLQNNQRNKERWKRNYWANKVKIKERHHAYYLKNKDKLKRYSSEYAKENAGKISEKVMKKYYSNSLYRLRQIISSSIRQSLRRKKAVNKVGSWESIVGYSKETLKAHLFKGGVSESQFAENKKFDIDHKVPLAWFSFSSEKDLAFRTAWCLENLQLLPKKENNSKRDYYCADVMLALSLIGR